MNRKYGTTDFRKVVNLLRENFPNVALTTDIIVGFPGETEEEFETTYNFLKEIKFAKMHVFKYSVRKGTVAEKMPNQISPEIKEERSHKLLELSLKNETEFLEQFLDKTVEVLFEEKEEEYYKGHTTNYMVVNAKGNNLENNIKNVKINKIDGLELLGTIAM